jgi:hypothetical protein
MNDDAVCPLRANHAQQFLHRLGVGRGHRLRPLHFDEAQLAARGLDEVDLEPSFTTKVIQLATAP